MNTRILWGLPTFLLAFLVGGSAFASVKPNYGAVTVEAISNLDAANGISVRELYPKSEKIVQAFSDALAAGRNREADAALATMAASDLRDYLLAYRDYSRSTLQTFVDSLTRSNGSHTPAYKMAAIKILIAEARSGHRGAFDVNRIYRNVFPSRSNSSPLNSSLTYVLCAEDALFCEGGGLAIARRLYRESIQKFPGIPALRNREAYLLESAGGFRQTTEGNAMVMTRFDKKSAITMRNLMRRDFPNYEPNYFFLATDYQVSARPGKAKEILKDYFKRFSASSPYYTRCKAMMRSLR